MSDAYLQPPAIHLDPGADHPEYADEARAFQGIPGIECAASGRQWATWYGGRGPSEDHLNCVFLATRERDGDWSSPVLVIDPDGDGPTRAYDPCLWRDPSGRLWLFWAQGYEKHTDETAGVWAICTDEPDAERPTWSAPRRLCDGIMMNKLIATRNGLWLLCAARWRRPESCVVWASSDEGATWTRQGAADVPEADRSCDEHMVIERADGSLWMLVRTGYGIGESTSTDEGRTWTPVKLSTLAHPVSRFFIGRLQSGRMLLIKHGPLREQTARSHLTAYLSSDEGKTWEGGLLIDAREGVSYPDAVELPAGRIHVIYDFDRRGARQILAVTLNEADILGGSDETPAAGPAPVVVNQAGPAR